MGSISRRKTKEMAIAVVQAKEVGGLGLGWKWECRSEMVRNGIEFEGRCNGLIRKLDLGMRKRERNQR